MKRSLAVILVASMLSSCVASGPLPKDFYASPEPLPAKVPATVAVVTEDVPLEARSMNNGDLTAVSVDVSSYPVAVARMLASIYQSVELTESTADGRKPDYVVRLGKGKKTESVFSARNDEVGQLEQAFTEMAAQLENRIDELQKERSTLTAVLANMTDGILIADRQGNVRLINLAAQRMFSVTEGDALGHSLIEVVRNHQVASLWRKSQSSGEQQTITLETSPDRLLVQGIATPLQQSLPGSILLVFQDLTRVRRLEMVRRDFVSNVSHELRTPLASLKALTETLMEGALEDPPAARRFLTRMEGEIDNLTQMVQ